MSARGPEVSSLISTELNLLGERHKYGPGFLCPAVYITISSLPVRLIRSPPDNAQTEMEPVSAVSQRRRSLSDPLAAALRHPR